MSSALRVSVLALAVSAMSASAAMAAPIQWTGAGSNGHWYDFIAGPVSWATALANANASTYDPDGPGGAAPLDGYLVTITSQAEQDFLNLNYINSGRYWIGHTDQAVEGTWQYAAGTLEAGQVFYQVGVGTLAGYYSNWSGGEPNNFGCGGEDIAVANWGANGSWNDWYGPGSTCTEFASYVVEYSVDPSTIPEPGTLTLLGFGLAAAGRQIRRRMGR